MSLIQGLHRSLQQRPDDTALTDGDRSWTFTELADRVARLAGGLASLGVASGERVGILSGNTAAFVETALTCPWGGFVLSPVNGRWSQQEIEYQIMDAAIRVLIVDGPSRERALELRGRFPDLTVIESSPGARLSSGLLDYETFLTDNTPVADSAVDSDSLAAIVYTGGTTGEPKGVMLSHSQISVSSLGTLATLGTKNVPHRFLHAGPLYHLAALGALYQQVFLGSSHTVLTDFTVERLAEVIGSRRITATSLVPTVVKRLLEHAQAHDCDLSSLTDLGYGASPISGEVLQQVMAMWPHMNLSQRYGMTELSPVATILRPDDHRDTEHPERLQSAGRPALHVELRVVDPDDRQLPVGAVGEVVVRGDNVMMGYWNKPAETADALRGGWMHTGDLGYLDEHGYLYLVDRLKDMIVTGGENVYSTEVERVLARHEAVGDCAVIGVADPDWGERVHAVVVLRDGFQVTAGQLREFCAEHIARYKAPRTVEFMTELPRSPLGKVLKRNLRADTR